MATQLRAGHPAQVRFHTGDICSLAGSLHPLFELPGNHPELAERESLGEG